MDAASGPVFRYLEAFERLIDLTLTDAAARVAAGVAARVADWRARLGARPSVVAAVASDYPARLEAFLRARQSHLGRLLARGRD